MCNFRDFEKFPEEFHRKLKTFLVQTRNHDLPLVAASRIAEELLDQMKMIELKMRNAYFGAGTRRNVMPRLTTTQVLAAQKTVVRVLKGNSLIPLTPNEIQELATEIIIALDEVIS